VVSESKKLGEDAVALPVWISNLIAYSLQIAILVAAGTLLAYLFRLRLPRVALIYWQALLLACIFVPLVLPWKHPVLGPAIAGSGAAPAWANGIAAPENLESPAQFPWEIVGTVLVLGIVLRLVWLLLGFIRLHLFQRKSRTFNESHAPVRDMQWRTGVRVPVLLSGEINSPVTFGFRSPMIILPLSFKNLSEPCQEAILCHELLHVRRYDWILIVVEEIIASVFWFHPAIWWLLSRVRLSREQAVDYEVVRITGNKQPYLDSLLEFARAHGRLRAVPAPLFLKESHLVQRVALLVKEVSMSRLKLAISIVSMSLLLLGTVYLAAGWFPLIGAPLATQEQNSGAEIKAPQTTPIRVAGDIQESKLVFKVEPVYPEEAKGLGLSGIVNLRVLINEEGQVSKITAQSGHPLFTKAAFDAVEKWRYSPTFLNGNPVSVATNVTCFFAAKETAAFARGSVDGGLAVISPPEFVSGIVGGMTVRPKSAIPPPVREQSSGGQIKAPLREPIRVGSMIQASKLIHRVEPVYPELAQRVRLQGTVRLTIVINEEGFVYELRTVEGNNPILEAAAIDAVKQWQYSPTLLNGEPVAAQATVTITFELK